MGVEIIPSGVIEGKVNGVVLTPADLYSGVGDGQAQGNSVGFTDSWTAEGCDSPPQIVQTLDLQRGA